MTPSTPAPTTPFFRQPAHLAALVLLAVPLGLLSRNQTGTVAWAAASLLTAVLHQGLVAAVWRAELFGNRVSRRFGPAGFFVYGVLFTLFVASRIVVAARASLAAPRTLPPPATLWQVVTVAVFVLVVWLMVTVFRHFGMKRALGADHFFPEYRTMPFVRRGIFRYTRNGMYTFGTLGFVLPGLLLQSQLGIAVGLYHYLAVWIHYWATERPDQTLIYGSGE